MPVVKRKAWDETAVVEIAVGMELLLGVVSSLFGIVGLVVAALNPIRGVESLPPLIVRIVGGDGRWPPRFTIADPSPISIVFLIIMLLSAVGILIGAYLHGDHRVRIGLVLLWLWSIIFVAGFLVCDISTAVYLLPSAPAALVPPIAGSFAEVWDRASGNGPGEVV